jgi:beta-phosphoglucomutase-like phosphatase (HAD superfamily)
MAIRLSGRASSAAGLRSAAGAGLLTLGVAHTYPAGDLAAADHVAPSLSEVSLDRLRELFARS